MSERNAFRLLVGNCFFVELIVVYVPPNTPWWLSALMAALCAWAICFAKETRHG